MSDCGTRRRLLFAIAASTAAPWSRALATDADAPFVLATSTPGGGFARYGETLARILDQRAGRSWIEARPTRGTTENLELLKQGTIDAALIQGTAASALFAPGATSDLRVLFAMYPSPGMLAVPASSRIERLEDVRGRRVVFGVRTSGLVTLGRQIYAGIDIDIDRDVEAIYVEQAAQSPRLVLDGQAVALWGAGEGWPGFETLAKRPGGARFIGPTPEQIPRIVARYPLLKPMAVAAGTYPGIARALPTVGSVNFIVARADLAMDRARRFVRAMRDAEPDIAAALPQAGFTTFANTLSSVPSAEVLHRAVLAER